MVYEQKRWYKLDYIFGIVVQSKDDSFDSKKKDIFHFFEKIRFENSLSDALKHRLFCLDLVSAISIYVYTQCE